MATKECACPPPPPPHRSPTPATRWPRPDAGSSRSPAARSPPRPCRTSIARAAVDPGEPPDRLDQGRRAHRRPDAGEPVLRPLLRHAARRPRLRRPAPGDPAERQVGLAPVRRHARGAAVPPRRRRPGPAVPPGPRPRLERRPRGVQRRPLRPVDPGEDADDDGVPDARGHPVPLRAGRRLHHLRRLPLLAASARPTRTATTCGPAAPATTARAAARSSTTTRPATAGRPTPSGWRRPGSPGRSTRTSATASTRTGSWGWTDDAYIGNYGDNSLLYFDQYRNAAARRPALRQGPHRHERARRARASSTMLRADVQAGKLPQVSWIVAPGGLHRAPELAGELRRLVHRAGARRADRRPRGVEQDRAVHHLRRERRLLRPRRPAVRRPSAVAGAVDRRRRRTSCYDGAPTATRRARTASASACRCSSSRRGARAATSARRSSTTPRSSGSSRSGSACTSRTSRRGAARSAAT